MQSIVTRLKRRKSDNFFDVVDAIGFGSKTTNIGHIRKAMNKVFPKNIMTKLENEHNTLFRELWDFADTLDDKYKIDNVFRDSDDGWSDAISHIIGLGKKSYNDFKAHPLLYVAEKTEMHGDRFWYVENFSYIFMTD